MPVDAWSVRNQRSTAAVKSTIEELGPTRVRMAIEVPWGDLDHAFGEVYKELGKQVRPFIYFAERIVYNAGKP